MNISLPQKVLAEQLQIVSRAVQQRSPIPVLEGILFSCNKQRLMLTATNLEMAISTVCQVPHGESGQVVLPGKISEIVRRLPQENIQLQTRGDNLLTEIISGQSEFELYGFSAADYPAMEPQQSASVPVCSFSLASEELRRALRQTLFATSQDEGKPTFTGVFFSLAGNKLTLAASDTFRLAVTHCVVQKSSGEGSFLVPAKTLQEAARIFTEDTVLQATVYANLFTLANENIRFASRLIDEKYPDIERVIPQKYGGRAVLSTSALLQALERASLLAEGTNNVVYLSLGNDLIVIRAASKYGKIQEKLPLSLQGEGVEIALNVRFLLDMLRVAEGEEVTLEFTSPSLPLVMKDSLYPDYLYLVLPIKK